MSGQLRRPTQERTRSLTADSMSSTAQASHARKKRAQVVRACDSCRQHRVKCDNHIPCSNCKVRGGQCSNAAINSTTLLQAHNEIERLKRKVDELESELREKQNSLDTEPRQHLSPPLTLGFSPSAPSPSAGHRHRSSPWCRDGIHVRAGQSPNETWYGPSSLFHFIGRISSCLGPASPQTDTSDAIVNSNPTSSLLDETTSAIPLINKRQPSSQQCSNTTHSALDGEYLSLMQEEYFLELYWHSYHTAVFPILDEAEFRQHYRSLWTTQGDMRRPSSLVDIVVAMSMQLGVSSGRLFNAAEGDATVAGQGYYLRCQKLLAYELESPSVSTLQCQILCSVYLCCATFQNMSDSACAMVVRTAYMLGLHIDPPATMPLKEREMRRRLWWAVYILDSKIGMKYGRPFLLSQSQFSPRLPDHTLDVAMQAGSSFAPLGDNLTWLSFHHQHAKLFLITRAIYSTIFEQQNAYIDSPTSDEQDALEAHAIALDIKMKELEGWVHSVPAALKTNRINNGHPFSTETYGLDIEPFAPLWLQRQRLLLELMYHNLCTNLYRPFISFGTAPASNSVEQAAIKCAAHASAFTNIMHQVLSSTTILTGWHEAFQWQWNASMTLVGFVLACPLAPSATDARGSIDLSLNVLDKFGESFAVAVRAANVVRQLHVKINLVASQDSEMLAAFGESMKENMEHYASNYTRPSANAHLPGQTAEVTLAENEFRLDEMTTASLQNTLNMAFDVDQWAVPRMLWPDIGGFGA
ncbi:putative transcriptional regulatory protein [Ilyonectria robusta]